MGFLGEVIRAERQSLDKLLHTKTTRSPMSRVFYYGLSVFVLAGGIYAFFSPALGMYSGLGLIAISLSGFLRDTADSVHDSNITRAVSMRLLSQMFLSVGALFMLIDAWSFGGWALVASIMGFAIAIGLFVHFSRGGSHRGLE